MKPDGRSLEEENSNFLKSVLRARKGRNKPFWSDTCKKAKTEREKARKVAETSPTIENIQSYKEKRAQADSTIKKEKQRFWDSKCNEMSLDTDLFRTLKNFRGDCGQQKDSATIKRSGDAGQPLRELSQIVRRRTCSARSMQMSLEWNKAARTVLPPDKQECGCNKENACSAFSLRQLRCGLRNLKNRKSPGHDEISNEMLKHLPPAAEETLLHLINHS